MVEYRIKTRDKKYRYIHIEDDKVTYENTDIVKTKAQLEQEFTGIAVYMDNDYYFEDWYETLLSTVHTVVISCTDKFGQYSRFKYDLSDLENLHMISCDATYITCNAKNIYLSDVSTRGIKAPNSILYTRNMNLDNIKVNVKETRKWE